MGCQVLIHQGYHHSSVAELPLGTGSAGPDELRRFQWTITVDSYQLFLMTESYFTQDLSGLLVWLHPAHKYVPSQIVFRNLFNRDVFHYRLRLKITVNMRRFVVHFG